MGSWELAKSKVVNSNLQSDSKVSGSQATGGNYNEYFNAEKKSAERKYSKMLYLAALFLVTDERNNKCNV